jgi:hypothetical protein
MTVTTALDHPLPRSYLPEGEKGSLPQNVIYACESSAAMEAGDKDAAWAWMAMADIPASAKSALESHYGEEFLKSKGIKL